MGYLNLPFILRCHEHYKPKPVNVTVNMTLFEPRVFADIKGLWTKSSLTIQMCPHPMPRVVLRRTWRRDKGVKGDSQVKMGQRWELCSHKQRNTWKYWSNLPSSLLREHGLQSYKEINLFSVKSPSWWSSLMTVLRNKYSSQEQNKQYSVPRKHLSSSRVIQEGTENDKKDWA